MKRADVIAAIEKRQNFNTSGGPNWPPRAAAIAVNEALVGLLVDLDLMSEKEARAGFRARKQAYDKRISESVERYNAEKRAECEAKDASA